MNNSVWYTAEQQNYTQMLDGVRGKLWPKLENSLHWPTLKCLIEKSYEHYTLKSYQSMLDYGCCAAALGLVEPVSIDYFYMGYDLKNIINNVSIPFWKESGKKAAELHFYEDESEINFDWFELVVCSAVLDIMQDPLKFLKEILSKIHYDLIIHRQFIVDDVTHCVEQSSYGGTTYISYINRSEFLQIVNQAGFEIIHEMDSGCCQNNKSFLLRKIATN